MLQQVKVADSELLTNWQRKNKEYKQRHQLNAHRESDTMARLTKFRNILQKPAEAKQPTAAASTVRSDAEGAAEPNAVQSNAAGTHGAKANGVVDEVSEVKEFHDNADGTDKAPLFATKGSMLSKLRASVCCMQRM